MGEPLRNWNLTESCHWVRHTIRPIEWARPSRVLAPRDWRRLDHAAEPADAPDDLDDSALASLLESFKRLLGQIEATDAFLDRAFAQLAQTRRRLDAQQEDIAALKRELRRA